MDASVLPQNATDPSFTWSVTPENLASISDEGLLKATGIGEVTVTATAADASGVTGTMDIVIAEKISGINPISDPDKITVYPNPALNGNFIIEGTRNISLIELYDLTGRKVTGFSNFNRNSVNVSVNAKPGIYILKLSNSTQAVYKKIMIK